MGLSFLFFKMRYRNRPLGVSSRYDLYAPTITIGSIYSLLVVFPNKSGYFFFFYFTPQKKTLVEKYFQFIGPSRRSNLDKRWRELIHSPFFCGISFISLSAFSLPPQQKAKSQESAEQPLIQGRRNRSPLMTRPSPLVQFCQL